MLLSRIVSLRNLKFLSTNLLTCHIKWLSLTSNIFDLSMSIGLNRPIYIASIQDHYPKWWAYLDLNQGPRPYQGRALTN